jgi:ATP-dependent Clp protease ATP-binding subunit ClpA
MDTSGYSPEALQMLRIARGEAAHLRHVYLGTEHLLLALTGRGSETPAVLGMLSLDATQVRTRIESIVQRGSARDPQ